MADDAHPVVSQPGGVLAPLEDVPRREGPADAPSLVVVVEPPEHERVARSREPLDTADVVAGARADALRGLPRRPEVVVGGDRYALPWDDGSALADFVQTLYLVRGWEGVHEVRDQLAQMVTTKLHPQRPPPTQSSADREGSAREQLALAGVREVMHWADAYQTASRLLGKAVLDAADRLEERAVLDVRAVLARSQDRVLQEMTGYFQWSDRKAAVAALRGLPGARVLPGAALTDLRTRMGRLRPPAVALTEARRRAGEEATRQRRSLGRDQVGIIPPWALAHLAALEQTAVEREAAFAAALLVEAPPRPVLYRLGLDTLVTDPSDTELAGILFGRLQRTWEATEKLTARLARTRPARDADRRKVYDGAVPEALVAAAAAESIWAFPKVIQAAAARTAADERLVVDRLLEEFDRAGAQHAKGELKAGLLTGVGMAALTIALTVVCPPAGIALDVALSVSDVFSSAEDFDKLGDEAVSDLDPRESLSDTDPSLVPVVLAVAGVLTSAI